MTRSGYGAGRPMPILRTVNASGASDGDRPPWSVTLTVAGIAVVLVALMVVGLSSDAPISIRLACLVMLFPAAFFAMLAWGFTYSAITGRRPPGADRINRLFGRLNSNV